MAKSRLGLLDRQIATIEQHQSYEVDAEVGDLLDKLKAERAHILEYRAERGQLGEFPESTPLNDELLLKRRKRSAVLVGDIPQLPLVAADKVAYPNIIARSPLFGLGASGEGGWTRKLIAQDGDTEILVTGRMLSQADLDVWLLCLKLAQDNLAKTVEISEYAFRDRLGKTHGSKTYQLLRESFARLAALMMSVRRGRSEYSVDERLVHYQFAETETGMLLRFSVGQFWIRLLGVGDWSTQLLSVRQRLAGKPLAQLLVTIGYTHKAGFPVTLESLHTAARSESKNSEFKRLAVKALEAAIEVGAFKVGSRLDPKKSAFVLKR